MNIFEMFAILVHSFYPDVVCQAHNLMDDYLASRISSKTIILLYRELIFGSA